MHIPDWIPNLQRITEEAILYPYTCFFYLQNEDSEVFINQKCFVDENLGVF